jgi:SARP family transcriptional regulator, regulator of embCAB operon
LANGDTRIQVCGRIAVELEGRDLTSALPAGQGRALFAYLVLHRDRPARRDELIDALWSKAAPPGAPSALSALLSRLRRGLGEDVVTGRGELRLQLPLEAWVDAQAVEVAIHRAQTAVARRLWEEAYGPSAVALAVARRGFLPAPGAPWADAQRRRLEQIRCAALECYAAVCLGLGDGELAGGEKAARELLAAAPYRERGYALLMELLAARGNMAEALIVYQGLRERLREDLGIAPGPYLRDLQSRLLHVGA